MQCVNLKRRFGDRYRVDYEEAYFAERTRRTLEDPWQMLVLCRNGHICPWGGSLLAACTRGRGAVAGRLRSLPFAAVVQDGDDGVNVLFDVKHFDDVAAIMRPRRRRHVSEAERQRLAELSRRYGRFRREAISQATNPASESPQTTLLV